MNILDFITSFIGDFFAILSEMSPYLLLGFFFAGLLYAFIPKQSIQKYFSGSPMRSSALAAFFGIPLPLCSCGVIPTGTAFYKNGASKGGTVSFLISTPQTGVDSILATFSLMGLPFAIIRPLAALVTGITGGLITSVVTQNEKDERVFREEAIRKKSGAEKVKDVFRYGFVEFIQDISKWLVIGLVLAAFISALVPDDFFELLNMPPVVQMLMILVVSIPLYICATGSIPLAAILILKGISPGAAFVLLMAGPATNAATITMLGKVMGKRSLFAYLGTIIGGALAFGLLIDYALPVEWFTQIANEHLGHQHSERLSWWEITSGVVLLLLIINGYYQKYKYKQSQKKVQPVINQQTAAQFTFRPIATKVIRVDGMTCNHCKANVESNLEQLDFIDSAKVNLAEKTVTLEGNNIELETVKETINSLGYTFKQ